MGKLLGGEDKPVGEGEWLAHKESSRQRQIYESTPTVFPQIDGVRLAVYPLNATPQQGQEPFVICVVPEGLDASAVTLLQMSTSALDPARIQLTLPDGTVIKPSGYALAARCSYRGRPGSARADLAFRELDMMRPLIWRRDTTEMVKELALRFDIATPAPHEKFSFDLGVLTWNKRQHDLPRIEFQEALSNPVVRATPQGHTKHEDFVNCFSKGERVWTYSSQCDK